MQAPGKLGMSITRDKKLRCVIITKICRGEHDEVLFAERRGLQLRDAVIFFKMSCAEAPI